MRMVFNTLDECDDRQQMYRNYPRMGPVQGPRSEETTIEAKLVVMGNSGKPATFLTRVSAYSSTKGVGKTSLVTRYTENRFSHSTTATTGALFVTHKTDFAGHHIKLQIWDTAGTWNTYLCVDFLTRKAVRLSYRLQRRVHIENQWRGHKIISALKGRTFFFHPLSLLTQFRAAIGPPCGYLCKRLPSIGSFG